MCWVQESWQTSVDVGFDRGGCWEHPSRKWLCHFENGWLLMPASVTITTPPPHPPITTAPTAHCNSNIPVILHTIAAGLQIQTVLTILTWKHQHVFISIKCIVTQSVGFPYYWNLSVKTNSRLSKWQIFIRCYSLIFLTVFCTKCF